MTFTLVMCHEAHTVVSDGLLHVPDEGAQSEQGVVQVELAQSVEQWSDLVVLNNRYYGAVH